MERSADCRDPRPVDRTVFPHDFEIQSIRTPRARTADLGSAGRFKGGIARLASPKEKGALDECACPAESRTCILRLEFFPTVFARSLKELFVLAWVPGTYELVIILVIALLLFGTRLPMVAKSMGSAIVQFKRALKGDESPEPGAPESPRRVDS